MRLRLLKGICLKDSTQQLGLAPDQLEKQLCLIVHIGVQDGTLLKVDGGLSVPHKDRTVLQRFEIDEFKFEVLCYVLCLLCNILADELI